MTELDVMVQTVETLDAANELIKNVTSKLSPDCQKAAVFLIGNSNVDAFTTLIKNNYLSLDKS